VQVGLGHTEGCALEVVGGYAHLTDELLLGCRELECGERLFAQAVQFLQRKLNAAVGIAGIGAEIDVEDTDSQQNALRTIQNSDENTNITE